MAINSTDNMKPQGVASLACDTASDIASLTEYAKSNNLKLGSTCLVVSTGALYAMDSDYNWHEL